MLIPIRVWSDFVCPWCYVGLAELEKIRPDFDVAVEWKSFYLRPDTPAEGLALPPAILARIRDPRNPLKARAAKLGLVMKERDVIPSTRRAHQAAQWAHSQGKRDAMHTQILRHYWTLGEDIGQWPALRAAAQDAGLDPNAMQVAVESGRFEAEVERDIDEAARLGIHAVPTFVLGKDVGIQGAQEAEVFREALRELGAQPAATEEST
jgi:predicted DsbA family dithiol-disulfide isomerase